MTNMVSNKQAVFSTLLTNRKMIKSFGVSKLGVFGSFITGNLKKNSDVDFLVEFLPEEESYDNYMNLFILSGGTIRQKGGTGYPAIPE